MIPTVVAGVRCAASYTVMLALDAALLALGHPIRPALLFDVFEAGIIIRKFAVKIGHRIEPFYCNARSGLHVRLAEISSVLPYLYLRDRYRWLPENRARRRLDTCDRKSDGSRADRTPTMVGSEMVASIAISSASPEPENYLALHSSKRRGTL